MLHVDVPRNMPRQSVTYMASPKAKTAKFPDDATMPVAVRLTLNQREVAAFDAWRIRLNQTGAGMATWIVRQFLATYPADGPLPPNQPPDQLKLDIGQ